MPAEKYDKQIVNKIERYCAFQERCRQEVSIKLQQLGVEDETEKEKIIRQLEKKGFLNEARYAGAFARDKFNLHGWGKVKIGISLQQKNIPRNIIDAGLASIDPSEYAEALRALLHKKAIEFSNEKDEFIRKNRIANYLIGRGFEPELVWEMIE